MTRLIAFAAALLLALPAAGAELGDDGLQNLSCSSVLQINILS